MLYTQTVVQSYPLFGLLISLLLFFGFYKFGSIILINKNISKIINLVSSHNYQKILIGVNLFLFIYFPIFIFFDDKVYILLIISIILIILGMVQIISFFKNFYFKFHYFKDLKKEDKIILFIIILYFLISLAPITHSDALDYHVSSSKYIISNGSFPVELNNFHNLLIGSGELIIALGLLYDSQQIGNLIQFSGLISLIGIIKKNNYQNFIWSLLVLTIPVIIFLCSSPKPQLFGIATNAVIFSIFFLKIQNFKITRNQLVILSILPLIFLTNSVNIKFSFILSSSLLYILTLIYFYEKKFLKIYLLFSICNLFLFYFPFIFWKTQNWGGNFINYLINPFPFDMPGIEYFRSYLTNYRSDNALIHLFIPRSLGSYTEVIGLSLIVLPLILMLQKKIKEKILPILLIYLFVSVLFGQVSGRFLIEPILWSIIIISASKLKLSIYLKPLVYFQGILGFIILFYGTLTLFPGSLTKNNYDNTMKKFSYGYSLFHWSNKIIDNNETVLSMHRSISLGKTKTLSVSFLGYVSKSDDIDRYIRDLEKYDPKYLLTFQTKNSAKYENTSIFHSCIDSVYAKKNNLGVHSGRNPFNQGESYNGVIFKLKNIKLRNCVDKDKLPLR